MLDFRQLWHSRSVKSEAAESQKHINVASLTLARKAYELRTRAARVE
jgi:hypothetical protein